MLQICLTFIIQYNVVAFPAFILHLQALGACIGMHIATKTYLSMPSLPLANTLGY